jgi:hypothetical protein
MRFLCENMPFQLKDLYSVDYDEKIVANVKEK